MTTKLVEIDFAPDERTLRQFGFVALGGFAALAACAWHEALVFSFGLGAARVPVTLALAALAALSALCSLVYPKANRALYVGTSLLAYPIGLVLSYAILAFLFFGVVSPIGALLRATGHDPLQRGYDRAKKSYFTRARPTRAKSSYFRQF